MTNKEYFEWLNKQPLSKKEYYTLFFARLKKNPESMVAKILEEYEEKKNDKKM